MGKISDFLPEGGILEDAPARKREGELLFNDNVPLEMGTNKDISQIWDGEKLLTRAMHYSNNIFFDRFNAEDGTQEDEELKDKYWRWAGCTVLLDDNVLEMEAVSVSNSHGTPSFPWLSIAGSHPLSRITSGVTYKVRIVINDIQGNSKPTFVVWGKGTIADQRVLDVDEVLSVKEELRVGINEFEFESAKADRIWIYLDTPEVGDTVTFGEISVCDKELGIDGVSVYNPVTKRLHQSHDLAAPTLSGLSVEDLLAGSKNEYVDFDIAGDADTYYPVLLSGNYGAASGQGRYSVSRLYNWTAPTSWTGSSTHKGNLNLTFEWNGGTTWDGDNTPFYVTGLHENYTTMCAGMAQCVRGMVIWLRGGGAKYRITSPVGRGQQVAIGLSADGLVMPAPDNTKFLPRTDTSNVPTEIHRRWNVRNGGLDNALYEDGLHLRDRYKQRLKGQVDGVDNSSWVKFLSVSGSQYGSAIEFTAVGTANNIVVNLTATISSSHQNDIKLEAYNSAFTPVNIRVMSDRNENFDVYLQLNTPTTTPVTLDVEVTPLSSETLILDGTVRNSAHTETLISKAGTFTTNRYIETTSSIEVGTNAVVAGKTTTGSLDVLNNAVINSELEVDGHMYLNGPLTWNGVTMNDLSTLNAGMLDNLDSTQFLRSDTTDTMYGGLETRYGISGGYGTNHGSGGDWGSCIWSMGFSYDGGIGGPAYNPNTHNNAYGVHWLRGSNSSASSIVGEGMYLYQSNGLRFAAGSAGLYNNGAGYFTGNITAYYSDGRLKDKLQDVDPEEAHRMVVNATKMIYRANMTGHKLGGWDPNKIEIGLDSSEFKHNYNMLTPTAPFDIDENGKSKTGENYLTFDYERFTVLLAASIEHLDSEFDKLKASNDELKSENTELKNRIEHLEEIVGKLLGE